MSTVKKIIIFAYFTTNLSSPVFFIGKHKSKMESSVVQSCFYVLCWHVPSDERHSSTVQWSVVYLFIFTTNDQCLFIGSPFVQTTIGDSSTYTLVPYLNVVQSFWTNNELFVADQWYIISFIYFFLDHHPLISQCWRVYSLETPHKWNFIRSGCKLSPWQTLQYGRLIYCIQ